MWTVKKLRYMIEASHLTTVIYTDHVATLNLMLKTSADITSLVRMNNRHIRASEYLLRFNLRIRYIPGK